MNFELIKSVKGTNVKLYDLDISENLHKDQILVFVLNGRTHILSSMNLSLGTCNCCSDFNMKESYIQEYEIWQVSCSATKVVSEEVRSQG